ncbi:REP element-mobilizing transposase RayT [Pseudoduganella lurida]|uniref:REP element-mobilizing transposase RayT n=1 Tax=Pseudoduganella lurida TaxID=1036180 RepID=A0A562R4S9_9BURK|nr:transposase [Pseudoduganella lurida]TWI63584.1 REP element-mobilizing transposase RayT [Pseudoduganella lurida]
MARAPRIQYPGALYHVTSRGNRRAHIYLDVRDYQIWQDQLAATVERFNFAVHAFCQMPNHYHMIVQTTEGNLSDGMRYLNGTYGQKFNWRHNLVGHVIQGRFHTVLMRRETQLLATARYVAWNPVRAELVKSAQEWRWGSYPHTSGLAHPLDWLDDDWLISQFGDGDRKHAAMRYRAFVNSEEMPADPLVDHGARGLDTAARCRRLALSLEEYQRRYVNRNEAMARAYFSTAYTMPAIAAHFGVSAKTVSRAAATFEPLLKAELVSMLGSDPTVDTNSAIEANGVGIIARKVV